MSVFKDGNGKEWHVAVNVAQVRLVRSKLKRPDGRPLDLYRAAEGGVLAELLDDPVLLVDTLWVLCSEQAGKDNVTDEQFGRAMYGDGLARATGALTEALIDFFPSPSQKATLQKMRDLMGLLDAKETSRLGGLDMEEEARKAMAAARPNGSSTARPASAGSTPAPSPSAS